MTNKILKKFEVTDVEIVMINGVAFFELYSLGTALGYVKHNTIKGKTYTQCRKDRVQKTLENAEIKPLVHDGLILLNENQVYDYMLEAHTDKCKPFRKWLVDEVIPEINKTGGYVLSEVDARMEFIEANFGSFSEDTKLAMFKEMMVSNDEIKKKNEELQKFYDDILNTEGLYHSNLVAKELNIGRNTMLAFLRGKKVMFYQDGANVPYQRFMNEGKFAIKETPCADGVYRPVTYFTKKGMEYVRKLLRKDGYYDVVKAGV